MAEAAILAGLGWVASPVLCRLVNKCISYLGDDIAEGLKDLETTILPQLQLTIEAAQHSPPNHKALLTKWLVCLKNAYFDAETILHDLEYERLKEVVKGKGTSSITSGLIKKAQKSNLLDRLNKLKEVAEKAKTFRDLLGRLNTRSIQNAGNNTSVTSSLLTDKVFGRDRECAKVINFLLDDDRDGDRDPVRKVAVTGMPGSGKTTLAQYIFNDSRVQKHFDKRIWLYLSQNSDIIEHTVQMIESVSGTRPNLGSLEALHKNLLELLPKYVNILVVLDNFWYDDNDRLVGEYQLENLLKPFIKFASKEGTCKIVVTSRSTLFPIALQPQKHIQLSDLPPHHFKSLLRYYAIDGLQINDPQTKNYLSDMSNIVDHIAEKMSKLPLAAKVVGNQLRGRPEISFWRDTLNKVDLSDVTKILLWSFHSFDMQLQRCFLFCSAFPKGTIFGLHTLMPYWVALDFFIQSSDNDENVEDKGLKCFKKMEANSIFQLVNEKYIMHDLYHDLAEMLSSEDCLRITNANRKEKICSAVQHVYLQVNNKNLQENLSSICHLSNLRTLILGNTYIDDISDIISTISENFKNLRVLDIYSRGCKPLPRDVGDLRNLRLLHIGKSSINELPKSVLKLYHLQFLFLPSSVKTLPTKLTSNLIKLQGIATCNGDGSWVFMNSK